MVVRKISLQVEGAAKDVRRRTGQLFDLGSTAKLG
jgi:hypothetical protein